MIKAVIFDLGNVIVKVDRTGLYKEWAEKSNKSVKEIIDYYANLKARSAFEKGRLIPKEFYQEIVKEIGLKMSFGEFKKSYCNIFSLNENVAKAIKKLKKHYRLVLLSNTDKLHFEYVKKRFKIVNIFDGYVLSYDVGRRKPNPLIFTEAIKKCKTLPFNSMYFDDIPEFIIIARLMGVKAYRFKDYKKMMQDLNKNKISAYSSKNL